MANVASKPGAGRVLVAGALLLVLLASLVGCSEMDGSVDGSKAAPKAPVITPSGASVTVKPGKTLAVRAFASDDASYTWRLDGAGEISSTSGSSILYTAPDEGGTMAVLHVIATNPHGKSPESSVTIQVPAKVSVSLEAVGIPAGWMSGGGDPSQFIQLGGGQDCHTGADCLRVGYRSGGQWGGIIWWPLACGSSGTREAWDRATSGACAISVQVAGGLTSVERLTFWARGEQGGEVIEFKVGAQDLLPRPGRSTGQLTLTPGWQQVEIDLEGVEMSRAVALFTWVATDLRNPRGATFFLDDIQFEGLK